MKTAQLRKELQAQVLTLASSARSALDRAADIQKLLGDPGGQSVRDALSNAAASAERAVQEITHP